MSLILRLRTCIVFGAALAIGQLAEGSSALVRQDSKAPPLTGATVKTYPGEMPASVSPVQPSSAITILVAPDTLSPTELTAVRKELLAEHWTAALLSRAEMAISNRRRPSPPPEYFQPVSAGAPDKLQQGLCRANLQLRSEEI